MKTPFLKFNYSFLVLDCSRDGLALICGVEMRKSAPVLSYYDLLQSSCGLSGHVAVYTPLHCVAAFYAPTLHQQHEKITFK